MVFGRLACSRKSCVGGCRLQALSAQHGKQTQYCPLLPSPALLTPNGRGAAWSMALLPKRFACRAKNKLHDPSRSVYSALQTISNPCIPGYGDAALLFSLMVGGKEYHWAPGGPHGISRAHPAVRILLLSSCTGLRVFAFCVVIFCPNNNHTQVFRDSSKEYAIVPTFTVDCIAVAGHDLRTRVNH